MNCHFRQILFCTTIILMLTMAVQASSAAVTADGPEALWIKEYPAEEIEILSVCESSEGGYYAAGSGPGGRLVMKLDEDGTTLWEKNVRGGNNETGSIKLVMESSAGGLLLFADGENLVKTTGEADFEWEFHQPSGMVYSVEAAPDGSGVLAGTYFQGFLTDVSPDGTEAWNRTFGSPDGGGQYALRSIQNDPGGGFIIAGYINPILMLTDYRGFLMRTDDEGDKIWARQYSGNASGMLVSVACRPEGGYAATRLQTFAGEDNSTLMIPSVIFTDAGGEMSHVVYYDDSVSYLYYITNAGNGGYYMSGLMITESLKDDEYKILRTGSSGKLLWEKTLGDLKLKSFDVTSDGGFIIAASSPGEETSYLIKYAKDNASEQAAGFGMFTAFGAIAGAGICAVLWRRSKYSPDKPE